MRILVTGGSGFLGSHLCDRLVGRGDTVVCLDDLSSGRRANIEHLFSSPRFALIEASVLDPINIVDSFDGVVHLASPASPMAYLQRPIFYAADRLGGNTECARIRVRQVGALYFGIDK